MATRLAFVFGLVLLMLVPCCSYGQKSGYIIEEEWTTPPLFGMPGTTRLVKTTIAGGKIRRDEADSSQIVLIRPDLGKLWMIRPKEKSYLEMDRETLQGLSMMAVMVFGIGISPETGKPIIPDSLFMKTGKEMWIGSWKCREILVRRPQGRAVSIWVSGETGLEPGVYTEILKKLMGPAASDYKAFFRQMDTLDGYPVLIESGMGGKKLTQKLIGVRSQPISDTVFEIPKGYRKAESPNG